MFLVPFMLSLVVPSIAVVCYDYSTDNYCCGDYCYFSRTNYSQIYVSSAGCVQGRGYSAFANKCWNSNSRSFCLCDGYHCNYPFVYKPFRIDEKYLAPWSNRSLNCGKEKDCVACKQIHTSEYSLSGCLRDYSFTRIESFMQPQACVRIRRSEDENDIHCLCDTGDNCDRRLVQEQKLQSEAVTCFMGRTGNQTCQGDYCFISTQSPARNKWDTERGCLTNNETLSPRLYQPGYFTLMSKYELVVCKTDECNVNMKKAKKSVKITEPSCPAPASPTTPRPEPVTRRPITLWTGLVNDLIYRITGYFG